MESAESVTSDPLIEVEAPATKISIRLLDKIETTDSFSGNSNS